jgi:microcystin-dependent protein
MPTLTLELPSAGGVITSGLHAANYADIQALLNGLLDGSNINQATVFALGGSGITLGADVNLYRLSANLLNTDDSFRTASELYAVGRIYAEADIRSGADTYLLRAAAGVLQTNNVFRVYQSGAAGSQIAHEIYAASEGFSRLQINSDGAFYWGSGAAAHDVVLTRSAANELQMATGDTFKLSNAGLKFNDGTTMTTAPVIASSVPPGALTPYGGSAAPSGWLLCDGTSYATATYPDLFAAIGYQFGGAGANFNVPNLKGRVPVGIDAAQTEFDTRGETGGAKTHALSTAELAVHSHGVTDPGHAHDIDVGGDVADPNGNPQGYANSAYTKANSAKTKVTGVTVNNAGSGNAHNNLQPYIALHYIIKT